MKSPLRTKRSKRDKSRSGGANTTPRSNAANGENGGPNINQPGQTDGTPPTNANTNDGNQPNQSTQSDQINHDDGNQPWEKGNRTPDNVVPTPDVSDVSDDEDAIKINSKYIGQASDLIKFFWKYRHGRLEELLRQLPRPRDELVQVQFQFEVPLTNSDGTIQLWTNWEPFTPITVFNDTSIPSYELEIRKAMNLDYQHQLGLFATVRQHGTTAENSADFYLRHRVRSSQLNFTLASNYERLRRQYLVDLRTFAVQQRNCVTPFPCECEDDFIELAQAVLKHQKKTQSDKWGDDDVNSLKELPRPPLKPTEKEDSPQINPFGNFSSELNARMTLKAHAEANAREGVVLQMHDPQTMVQLKSLTKPDITKWVTSQRLARSVLVPMLDTIPVDVQKQMAAFLQMKCYSMNENYKGWATFKRDRLCNLLEAACRSITYSGKSKLDDQIAAVTWPDNIVNGWHVYAGTINNILDNTTETKDERKIVDIMRTCLEQYCADFPLDNDNDYVMREWKKSKNVIKTVSQVMDEFIPAKIHFIQVTKENADKINYTAKGKSSSKSTEKFTEKKTEKSKGNKSQGASQKHPTHKTTDATPTITSKEPYCNGCGRRHPGGTTECKHKTHQHFNKEEGVRYEDSTVGQALAKLLNKSQVFRLPLPELSGREKSKSDTQVPGGSNKRRKGNEAYDSKCVANISEHVNSINTCISCNNIHKPLSNVYIKCQILHREQVEGAELTGKDTVILLDTGANNNYIDKHLADHLASLGTSIQPCSDRICSGIGHNLCITCLGILSFILKIKNNISNNFDLIKITAKIIEMSSTDIIIGNDDIFHYIPNLIERYSISSVNSKPQVASLAKANAPTSEELVNNADIILTEVDTVMYVNPLDQLEHDYEYKLSIEDDFDAIRWSEVPLLMPDTNNDLPIIQGSDTLQLNLKNLCEEYKDIFSRELMKEPAKIPPFELIVDIPKWERSENRLPPRKVGMIKDSEIKRQVDSMIAAKVVEESQAPYYSQVLLTPKPNNEWRFCVDYRRLNDATSKLGWPIPNIHQMLRRIGESKAKIFAKIDFTKGYYQAPLSMSSRALTAFICFCGVYQWLRVPMGLKGAPSYFQKEMATLVLGGLIHIILELYIDDILIHGKTEDEFLERVRKVFERLRNYRITVNPKKCIFGAPRIEFVGHEINEKGMKFSEEKIRKVIDFAVPITPKQLQGFLGLANYFRDHIESFSIKGRPLYEVLIEYNKTNHFVWTKEASEAFSHIKNAINKCPQLFFVSETAPVTLRTDASNYGLGGYLYQTIDGVEHAIQFVSKAFTDAQLNWETKKKEGYAIVYCVKKLEYLLRDIEFLIQTDHKNLTYITETGTPIVSRWRQILQEFNFRIEYVPGPENIVADGFSRLLSTKSEVDTINYIAEPSKAFSEVFHAIEYVNNIESTIRIPNDQYRLITEVHNSQVGHRGLERTIQLLKANNHQWPLMRQHVKQFIKHCPCCQKMSYIKYPIHAHPFTLSTYEPFIRIHMDTIGEMPRKDEAGNLYVLVIRDSFTRFTLLYPIPDTSAKHAVKCLMHMFGLFGCPAQILSDNGSQFVNEIIAEFTKQVQVEHLRTMAYSKEENGLVERANKEVNRYLRDLIYDLRVDATWSDYIPMIQRIINSTVNESTGLSPAEIIFGNSIDLDRGMFNPISGEERPVIISDWMAKMLDTQARLLALAKKKLKAKDDKHISEYDPTRTEFAMNSYVLTSYPIGMNGTRKPPTRFHPILKGPYRVINSSGPKYTIQNLVTYRNEDVHVTNLRPFNYDPERVNLQEAASRDRKEFIIDRIVSHVGDFKVKRELKFLVKWLGYEESDNTYEPWSHLRDTEQLHAYLIRCGLQQEIPRKFRAQYQLN